MTNQNNIIVGDHVRVLSGSHTGEIATVGSITWLSDQLGPYARFRLTYEGGKVAYRSMENVEKVTNGRRS
jgi:ribosomal protein L24